MAVSRDTRVDTRSEQREDVLDRLLSVSRYDLVLAVIPVAFLLAMGTATVTPLPIQGAVVAASVAGVLALVDALFVNPPRPGEDAE